MNIYRKSFGRLLRITLLSFALMAGLLVAQPALAQEELPRTELTMFLRDGGDGFDFNNEARAGQDNRFFLEVRNVGNTTISNIRLAVEAPEGWNIIISPATIDTLNAGSLFTADVNIKPTGGATREGKQIRFTAEANEIQKRIETFFVTVKPAQQWIWIWIAVGAVVVAGFVFVYLKMNKQ